ncbi:MAG: hypothetical protein CMJ58_06515 [Planctomycetaceae bacterium]|nr:hypothetical protein [Planctomycetaceae bacterium]
MNRRKWGGACALIAIISAGSFVHADDVEPANFRGDPNSVMAKIDLTMGPPTIVVTEGANPTYPLSTIPPTVSGPVTGPTPGGQLYQIELPNYIDDLPLKLMRIQYSWFGASGDARTETINVSPNIPGGSIQLVDSIPPMPVPSEPNAFYRWDDFEIRPNPDFEAIQVEFINADPRWLVIDTISTVPEPASLTIASLAGMILLAWRRR